MGLNFPDFVRRHIEYIIFIITYRIYSIICTYNIVESNRIWQTIPTDLACNSGGGGNDSNKAILFLFRRASNVDNYSVYYTLTDSSFKGPIQHVTHHVSRGRPFYIRGERERKSITIIFDNLLANVFYIFQAICTIYSSLPAVYRICT